MTEKVKPIRETKAVEKLDSEVWRLVIVPGTDLFIEGTYTTVTVDEPVVVEIPLDWLATIDA